MEKNMTNKILDSIEIRKTGKRPGFTYLIGLYSPHKFDLTAPEEFRIIVENWIKELGVTPSDFELKVMSHSIELYVLSIEFKNCTRAIRELHTTLKGSGFPPLRE
jgi:hypothetical protein